VTIIKMPKYPCSFCKKKEATQFCDFVIDHWWTSAKDNKGRMIGRQEVTCDNQICKECLTNVVGLEYCPSCFKLYEYIQKNHDKRKGRMMGDITFGRFDPEKDGVNDG
jgi:hypothetical protein